MLWLVAAALAQEPCATDLAPPPETLSVAWVTPLRTTTSARGWLDVVSTADLRAWVEAERPSTGRMLQRLGLRKSEREPKRRYKVTIFEVRAGDLCRPIADPDGLVVGGMAACETGGKAAGNVTGCGYTTDTTNGARGPDLYRIRWEDAAVRGFCVLPAERFVAEAASR